MLRDVAAMDSQRHHATEFVLYPSSRVPGASLSGKSKVALRGQSTDQKIAWKSVIEQRVRSLRGSLDIYSSNSDLSSSSASAIVI